MGNGQNQPSEYEARQFNTPIYVGKRALDFSPFQAALADHFRNGCDREQPMYQQFQRHWPHTIQY